jgi:hypothetical protein
MKDRKVGPTGGKLTQIVDMMQVQNINQMLQLTVHSFVPTNVDKNKAPKNVVFKILFQI